MRGYAGPSLWKEYLCRKYRWWDSLELSGTVLKSAQRALLLSTLKVKTTIHFLQFSNLL